MLNRQNEILYQTLGDKTKRSYLAINDSVYRSILSSLGKESSDKTAQSHMIIGPDGGGKTVILERIKSVISDSSRYYPIAIDGRNLFSVDDIWNYCPGGDFDNVLEWQRQNERRIVLLIDDVQYLFKRTNNSSQFSLRGKLNNVGTPILVATSNEVLTAFTEYNAAFFDGFKLNYIRPIDDDAKKLVGFSDSDMERVNFLMEYLPKTIHSLLLIKRVIRLSENKSDDLIMLCDLLSPSFRANFDSFSHQYQRILLALSSSDSGMPLSRLREVTKQDGGILSPYIKKLVETNVLIKETPSKRNATYRIRDSLFELWLSKISS
jgi:hypothetical protein